MPPCPRMSRSDSSEGALRKYNTPSLRIRVTTTPKKTCLKDLSRATRRSWTTERTDGTHVTAGQLALALTPYAQAMDLAVNRQRPATTQRPSSPWTTESPQSWPQSWTAARPAIAKAEPALLRTTWRETPRPAPWPNGQEPRSVKCFCRLSVVLRLSDVVHVVGARTFCRPRSVAAAPTPAAPSSGPAGQRGRGMQNVLSAKLQAAPQAAAPPRSPAQANPTRRAPSLGAGNPSPQSQSLRASPVPGSHRSLPPPSFDQLVQDIEAAQKKTKNPLGESFFCTVLRCKMLLV